MCAGKPRIPKTPPAPKAPPAPQRSASALGRSQASLESRQGESTLRQFSIRFRSPFNIPE